MGGLSALAGGVTERATGDRRARGAVEGRASAANWATSRQNAL
jgi:hypothetical protein